ncbi:MAG: hypothetical protein H7308_17450 [Chthonomonadaceae bacterium]|nr:hypothetical protein [Chthonomonadaceae bacterium]
MVEELSEWIHVMEAARRLGLQTHSMKALAERQKFKQLRRWDVAGHPYFYLWHEIEAYEAALRHRARYRRSHPIYAGQPYVEKMSEADARSCGFLTVLEAAAVLQVSGVRVGALVKSGKLVGYQNLPGQKGSKMFLSKTQVRNLANDRERLEQRRNWEKGDWSEYRRRQVRTEVRCRSHHPPMPPGVITALEASEVLGISCQSLVLLRKKGRISGFHAYFGKREGCRREGKRWYYSEKEIWELLEHEGYQEKRDRIDEAMKARLKVSVKTVQVSPILMEKMDW